MTKRHQVKIEDSKRLFDVLFSGATLLLLLPLFVLIALAIKLSSPGPIFYSSKVFGKKGTVIHCYKFRTMCDRADERLHEILFTRDDLRLEWQKYSKLRNDPRVTMIGKFLRKTSLDEFPQFWNVFKGDLSVVGPRPFKRREIRPYRSKKNKILSIRPGITGLWQTSGRNLLTFEERLNLDETYLEKRSFLLDLKLIAKTIVMMFFPKGAF